MAAFLLPYRAYVFSSSSAAKDEENNRCSFFPASETVISTLSHPFVKHCVKLRLNSSYRHSNSAALVVGFTPISEILRFEEKNRRGVSIDGGDSLVECLMLLDEAEAPIGYCHGGEDACPNVVRVSREVMRKVSGLKSVDSTEAIAVFRIPRSFVSLEGESTGYLNRFGCKPHRILVLDGIQDPGNLGTLLRSAMAFKWDGVFLLPGCCDPFNEKALRAARGSSFQLPIVCGNWGHLKSLRDHFKMKMLAAHPEENNEQKSYNHSQLSLHLADVLSDKPLCLVLGSEGQGISKQTKLICELVSIPMAGEFESLNVSVAGGILLFLLQTGICSNT